MEKTMLLPCLDIFSRKRVAFEMPASKPTIPTSVHIVRALIFPVVMYRCESWTIKRLGAEE